MSDVAPRAGFQFRLRTILILTACLAVWLAFHRAAAGSPHDGVAQVVGLVYAIMLAVCLLGRSSRFA
jgi:hypothetical protein